MRRRRPQKENPRVERSDVLKTHLGDEKYKEVLELANAIEMLRLNRIATGCVSCSRRSGSCERISPPPSISAQKVMPLAVRNLYFNTYLKQAVETAPVQLIPQLPWDTMIETAKSNIKAYKEWSEHDQGTCDEHTMA
jgi:hypothetical protein